MTSYTRVGAKARRVGKKFVLWFNLRLARGFGALWATRVGATWTWRVNTRIACLNLRVISTRHPRGAPNPRAMRGNDTEVTS